MPELPDAWSPRVWPQNTEAKDALNAYLDNNGQGFYAIGLDFANSDLTGLSPGECWVSSADFTDSVLEDVDLSGAHATDVQFIRAKLARAELSKAMLFGGTFDGADLTSANLSRADAAHTSFVRAKLKDAIMIAADLRSADLSSADLTRCKLNWAMFDNAVLTGTTTVAGAAGTVRAAVMMAEGRTLEGVALEHWFADRGALVKVESSGPR